MKPIFLQLNDDWNADPNNPDPRIELQGPDLLLRFFVNGYAYEDFDEGEIGLLRFSDCESLSHKGVG